MTPHPLKGRYRKPSSFGKGFTKLFDCRLLCRVAQFVDVVDHPLAILAPPTIILDHGADFPEIVIQTTLPLHLYRELLLICIYE
jgi:hypothetical protein